MFFIPNFWGHMRLLQCQQVVVVDGWEETASKWPFRACKKNVIYPLQTVVGVVARTHSLVRTL
jgi:hypothetical protein|eukprot:COSAG01_NODE_24444_length_778_cov_7.882180_1_plen_63_part_00